MGQESRPIEERLTLPHVPPEYDEIEVSLFGPGYGECVLVHIGSGRWVVVDSCLNSDSEPTALAYLRSIGSNPSEAVALIVATHWHDDHIRGIADLVEECLDATFCCASALGSEEFLAALGALEKRPATATGSGARELYRVFSLLVERSTTCAFAIPHRRVLNLHGCEIWSLSPSDKAFGAFLQQVGSLLPRELEAKRWIPSLTPNEAAVVLLISLEDTTILLGADLERRGWLEMLETYDHRQGKASVFKLPHHGSQDAHEDRVWKEMLSRDPIATLTPWRRGGRELPKETDIDRILSFAGEAYVTASRQDLTSKSVRGRSKAVERTIRESGARIRSVARPGGMIRLRKKADSSADWNVDVFGSACRLEHY